MWDTVDTRGTHLPIARPCEVCGHAPHTYLPCSDSCACSNDRPLAGIR